MVFEVPALKLYEQSLMNTCSRFPDMYVQSAQYAISSGVGKLNSASYFQRRQWEKTSQTQRVPHVRLDAEKFSSFAKYSDHMQLTDDTC